MKIEWSKQARSDVKVIFEYLKTIAGAKTAHKIVRKIYARPGILVNNPLGGQRELSLEDLPKEYRRLVEGNYKIVYRINGDIVDIVAVWDTRRAPESLREELSGK